MVGAGQVLLHLLNIGPENSIRRIFVGIDGPVLQGNKHLSPGQRGGGGADGSPEGHVVAVLHGADLKPLKVCQGLQVPVGGGEAVGGVLLDAQQFQTGGLIGGGHGGMGLAVAVEHLVDGLAVILGKHHGQVEDSHLRDKVYDRCDLGAH